MKKYLILYLCSLTLMVDGYAQGTISALNCLHSNTGTLTSGLAASGVSSVFLYTGGNGGTYTALDVASTGVTGLRARIAAGTFALGSGSLTFTISGTPASCGTASFAISIGGKSCTMNRLVAGTAPIGTLSCATALHSGTLTTGAAASGVTSKIPYTGGTGCPHNGQTVASTGVTGLTATLFPGSFAASGGSGNLTYTISGTPAGLSSSGGIALFAINIGGKTCTLSRTVLPVGTITGLNCGSSTNTGILNFNQPAAGVSSSVPYTGGNGGSFNAFSVASTGVTGLTAQVSAGQFALGNGSLSFTISGTPTGSGEARFALSIGGVSCTLIRNILPAAVVTGLNCATAIHSGTLCSNRPSVDVFSTLSYTGGNGGFQVSRTISSTGVSGLTAFVTATQLATGNGSLSISITGTPTSSGEASFAINIGGISCNLKRTVLPPGTVTTLNCSGAQHFGQLKTGLLSSGTFTWVGYSGSNGGYYDGQTIGPSASTKNLTATLVPGIFSTSGSPVLVYRINGTPSSAGLATFNISIGGKSCSFSRMVYEPATLSNLNCTFPTNTGELNAGSTYSASIGNITSTISYSGGNGGAYGVQYIPSSGVTGLTAFLPEGVLSTSSGSITLIIYGTPSRSGTARFSISIGGVTCELTREVMPGLGTITSLGCSSVMHTGTLSTESAASGVSSTISYSGGNGMYYPTREITSTGVIGLTATLPAGYFNNGSGSLTLTISGVASCAGTANFALSIGGQNCVISRTVTGPCGISSSCGAPNIHNPAKTYGSLTDQQGNVYKTIAIGTQVWMAENLKTTLYRDGSPILQGDACIDPASTNGFWSYYPTVESTYNCPYGKLYNWYAISNPKNLCPAGWHVPNNTEWNSMISFLGGAATAGKKLKTKSLYYWAANSNPSNESGFSALGGGYIFPGSVEAGCFSAYRTYGTFWTTTPSSCCGTLTSFYRVDADGDGISLSENWLRSSSFSVRCIKDASGGRLAAETEPDPDAPVLYPNPASTEGMVNLDVLSSDNSEAGISILDVTGRVQLKEKFTLFQGKNTISLRTSHLPAGIYRVLVKWNDQQKKIPLIKE